MLLSNGPILYPIFISSGTECDNVQNARIETFVIKDNRGLLIRQTTDDCLCVRLDEWEPQLLGPSPGNRRTISQLY